MKYLIYIISFLFICNINTPLASNNKIVIEDDLTDKDSKNQAPLLRHDIEEGDHNPSSGASCELGWFPGAGYTGESPMLQLL